MRVLLWILLILLPASLALAQEQAVISGDHAYIVHDYQYEPGDSGGDQLNGLGLCGTRCNALSIDYRNIIDPGGWRFIKVATNREIKLDLENPFMGGQCVCTVDEYVITINDFNQRKTMAIQ